jgi:hypothetical protein
VGFGGVADNFIFDAIDEHDTPVQPAQGAEQAGGREPDQWPRIRNDDGLSIPRRNHRSTPIG